MAACEDLSEYLVEDEDISEFLNDAPKTPPRPVKSDQKKTAATERVITLMCSEIPSLMGANFFERDIDKVLADHVIKYESKFALAAKVAAVEEQEIHGPNCDFFRTLFYSHHPDGIIEQSGYFTHWEEFAWLREKYPDIAAEFDRVESVPVNVTSIRDPRTIREEIEAVAAEAASDIDFKAAVTIDEVRKFDEAVEAAGSHLSEADRKRAKQGYIRHRGAKLEEKTVANLKDTGYDIRDGQKLCMKKVQLLNGLAVRFCGRVDGLAYKDGKPWAVVEIKNRKKKFGAHEHEKMQIALYAKMMNLSCGILVEQANGKIKANEMASDGIEVRWRKILNSEILAKQVSRLLFMLANPKSAESIAFAQSHL